MTAICSSDDEETQPQQDGALSSSSNSGSQQFTISSHDSFVSPDIDDGLCDGQPKSHADFEAPPFLVKVLLNKGFILGQSIGSGTYGKCYLATYTGMGVGTNGGLKVSWAKKGHFYAVKVTEKRRLSMQYRSKFLMRELRALLSIPEHPNIVRAYDLFTVSELVDNNPKSKM